AMDESLGVKLAAALLDRARLKIIRHDVIGGDECRRERAGEKEKLRMGGGAGADMAIAVEHAERIEDAGGEHEVAQDLRVHGGLELSLGCHCPSPSPAKMQRKSALAASFGGLKPCLIS